MVSPKGGKGKRNAEGIRNERANLMREKINYERSGNCGEL